MQEIRTSTILSKTELKKKVVKQISDLECIYCGEKLGISKRVYVINGKAFHDECELDHLLGLDKR